jgi:hypothetical protein
VQEESKTASIADVERGVVPPEAWSVLREQADVLVRSGFLPHGVNTPEKAISIVMKGRELGIPPMYALSNIAVINGKPTASAELMLALVYRDHGDEAVKVIESTPDRCTVAYRRRGWQEPELFSFTIEDAGCAGLLGKDNWRKYPSAMLRARCISAVARFAFPDTIAGLYTPEELGAAVLVREDGQQYLPSRPESRDDPVPTDVLTAEVVDDTAPRQPATANQRAALARLAALLDLPEPSAAISSAEAVDLLGQLSRRFNELDPQERRRRTRRQGEV